MEAETTTEQGMQAMDRAKAIEVFCQLDAAGLRAKLQPLDYFDGVGFAVDVELESITSRDDLRKIANTAERHGRQVGAKYGHLRVH